MNKFTTIIFTAISLLTFCFSNAFAAKETSNKFYVRDYGAVGDGITDDSAAFRKAVGTAASYGKPAQVIFDAKKYLFMPENGSNRVITLNGNKNLTITGVKGKTEIIIGDPLAEFITAYGTDSVHIENLTIDYKIPPFTQGVITNVNQANGTFDLKIDDDMPLPSDKMFSDSRLGLVFDAEKRQLKAGISDHIFMDKYEKSGVRTWTFYLAEAYKGNLNGIKNSDRFVLLARKGFACIAFVGSNNCNFENITMHASPSLAYAVMASVGRMTFRNCTVSYRPDTKRLLTTNGDAIQAQKNRIGPIIEKCFFEGMADDAVNIYSVPSAVTNIISPDKLAINTDSEIRIGDKLQIFNPVEGKVLAEVIALNVEDVNDNYILTLSKPVESIKVRENSKTSDSVFNLSASGSGFIIRNNTIGTHRRHGFLIRANNGLIENNIMDNNSGFGIVLTNEPGWPEGLIPSDVIIKGNKIIGGAYCAGYEGGGSILVQAISISGGLVSGNPVKNILIEKNQIINPRGKALFARVCDNLKIINNTITPASDNSIVTDGCINIVVKGNK